jgi:hypothetical protein
VRVNDREIDEIARVTAMATADIKAQYLRHSDAEDQWFIQQTVDDTQCVFLEGNKCSIYQGKSTHKHAFASLRMLSSCSLLLLRAMDSAPYAVPNIPVVAAEFDLRLRLARCSAGLRRDHNDDDNSQERSSNRRHSSIDCIFLRQDPSGSDCA